MVEIKSINQYLKFVKDYYEKSDGEVWYRGHWVNWWPLKPNLYRNARMITSDNSQEVIELEYKFVDFQNEFLKLKEEILKNKLFDISELNNFQIMFIAQHYGLLTPVLDWTIDPLVALFFALDGHIHEKNEFPIIYIMRSGRCNSWSCLNYTDGAPIDKAICIDGDSDQLFKKLTKNLNKTAASHIPIAIYSKKDFSHRICRQSGRFTFHGAVGPINYRWNDIIIDGEPLVDQIKINNSSVKELKEYLDALNINKETIYRQMETPLDQICNSLKNDSLLGFKCKIKNINSKLLRK